MAYRLRPSSAYQWAHCRGSIQAQAGRIDKEAPRTREGTATHWVGEDGAVSGLTDLQGYLGMTAPNGLRVTQEMVDGAQIYLNDMLAACAEYGMPPRDLIIEGSIPIASIHPENGGTPDAVLIVWHARRVIIWDYKHGRREVRARNNFQLLDYLRGVFDAAGIDDWQSWTVDLRVVQPFCYRGTTGPVDQWVASGADCFDAWRTMSESAHAIAAGDDTLSAGPWCRDCKAILDCATARRAGYSVITYADEPYQMDEISGPDLAREYDLLRTGLEIIKDRAEAAADELQARIAAGDATTGKTLQTSPGKTQWTAETPVVVNFCRQFGVEVMKDPEPCTPAQATEKAPAAVRENFKSAIKSIATRKSGALKIVDAADSRASKAFGGQ